MTDILSILIFGLIGVFVVFVSGIVIYDLVKGQHMTNIAKIAAGSRVTLARFALGRFRLRLFAGRATHDPEKMVLPGIIYVSKRDEVATAYALVFGWWDFHIGAILAVCAYLKEQHHAE